MHRFYYRNEQMIIDKHRLQDYYDMVDAAVRSATPRRMSLVGNRSFNCETQEIFQYGSVRNIWVYSDETGIRSMKMKLTNGNEYDYGTNQRKELEV